MPRQTMSPIQKVSTPKRRAQRRTTKNSATTAPEPIIRPATPVSAQSMNGSGLQLLLLVVLLVLLGGGGYYWFSQQQKSTSDAVYQDYQIPLGVNVPTAPEPVAETVLQKYQDDLAQYSFAYPEDWSIVATSTTGNKRTAILSNGASTTISVVTARTPKPLAQYVSELDALSKTAAGKSSIKVEESRDVAVNTIPVIARRQTLLTTGQQELIAYFGIKDYVVSIAVTDAQIATSTVQMYESLVNSFATLASSTPTTITTSTATTTATSTQGVQ